jgi:hypothetical protein
LAVRLALSFNSSTTEVQEIEKQQVEKHLRVCMLVHDGFERVVTIAPSEPLVAEAARNLMSASKYATDMPSSLLKILEIPGMDKGERGELAAEVILLKAYDSAYTSTVNQPSTTRTTRSSASSPVVDANQSRAVKLLTFIEHLLHTGSTTPLKPSSFFPTKMRIQGDGKASFNKTFSNSWIYFNHFVKLDEGAVINREFLWRLILRGAVVACANNQRGTDFVLPFLLDGTSITPENVSAIIIQVKNDGTYTKKPKLYLFDAMNPFWLGIFTKADRRPPPIIRMVFALASSESSVSFITAKDRATIYSQQVKQKPQVKIAEQEAKNPSPAYTTFDIWCAKACHATFKAIETNEEANYANLLKIKKVFPKAYEAGAENDDLRQNLRKQMNPGTATHIEHWRYLSGDIAVKGKIQAEDYDYENDDMDVDEEAEVMEKAY